MCLASFLLEQVELHQKIQCLCFAEYNQNGLKFKCHPNYHGDGPWCDNVLVNWQCNDDDRTDGRLVPARVLLFFEYDDVMYAVIHSCHDTNHKFSVLSCFWKWEYRQHHENPQASVKAWPLMDLIKDKTVTLILT